MFTKDLHFDILDIYTEGMSKSSKEYLEAAESFKKGANKTKQFVLNATKWIANKWNKRRITEVSKNIASSKGDIDRFKYIKALDGAVGILKDISNADCKKVTVNIETALKALRNNREFFENGYSKKSEFVIMEYEAVVYMMYTTAQYALACYYKLADTASKQNKREAAVNGGVIFKTFDALVAQISDAKHKSYLKDMTGIEEQIVLPRTESITGTIASGAVLLNVVDTIYSNLVNIKDKTWSSVKVLKNTLFGIIPLIQAYLSVHYRNKAEKIIALDEQVYLIEQNIERLKNKKGIDEEKKKAIIKKQQATADRLRKVSEKLRAELIECERDAAEEIKETNDNNKKDEPSTDDDVVLG